MAQDYGLRTVALPKVTWLLDLAVLTSVACSDTPLVSSVPTPGPPEHCKRVVRRWQTGYHQALLHHGHSTLQQPYLGGHEPAHILLS